MKLNDIAESMRANLNSKEHKSLFADQYKTAAGVGSKVMQGQDLGKLLPHLRVFDEIFTPHGRYTNFVNYLQSEVGKQKDRGGKYLLDPVQLEPIQKLLLADLNQTRDEDIKRQLEESSSILNKFLAGEWQMGLGEKPVDARWNPEPTGGLLPDHGTPMDAGAEQGRAWRRATSKYGQATRPVQERLNSMGYDLGPLGVDNDWGLNTEKAFQKWRAEHAPQLSNEQAAERLMMVEPKTASSYDTAINSLLTASAALDHLGLDRGSYLTLKIASLVVEAKAKKKIEKKKSSDSKKPSSKSDSLSAKDKKSKDDKSSSKSLPVKKKVSKSATEILSYKTAQQQPIAPGSWQDTARSVAKAVLPGGVNTEDPEAMKNPALSSISPEQWPGYQTMPPKTPKQVQYSNQGGQLSGTEQTPATPPAPSPGGGASMTKRKDVETAQALLIQMGKAGQIPQFGGADGKLGQHTINALNAFIKEVPAAGPKVEDAIKYLNNAPLQTAPGETPAPGGQPVGPTLTPEVLQKQIAQGKHSIQKSMQQLTKDLNSGKLNPARKSQYNNAAQQWKAVVDGWLSQPGSQQITGLKELKGLIENMLEAVKSAPA